MTASSSPAALEDIQSAMITEPDGSFKRLKYDLIDHSFGIEELVCSSFTPESLGEFGATAY